MKLERIKHFLGTTAGVFLLAAGVFAELPPGGKTVLNLQDLPVENLKQQENGNFEVSSCGDLLRFSVVKPTKDQWWTAMLKLCIDEPLEQGDALLLAAEVKTDEVGTQDYRPQITFLCTQTSGESKTRLLSKLVRPGTDWQLFTFPFTVKQDAAPGEAYVIFAPGPMPQNVDIRSLRVVNYKKNRTVDELPKTRIHYQGQDPDAPWRQAAQERIDQIRKQDLTVQVTGPDGNPLAGATVEIRMQNHAFAFGSAVNARFLAETAPDNPDRVRYLEAFFKNFNWATPENGLKQAAWEKGSRAQVMPMLDLLQAKGIKIHGHTLIWGWDEAAYGVMPESSRALFGDPAALQAHLLESITDRVAAVKGRVEHWDVINEQIERRAYQDVVGFDKTLEWFAAVRAVDPRAGLMINDFDILNGKNVDAYVQMIRNYQVAGVQLAAIGVQGHMSRPVDLDVVWKNLDKLAALGLPILITEFDLESDDEALQADYMHDLLTQLFSHPAVEGFIQWGFWAGMHWRPDAALYRTDWSEKPNLLAYRKLVFGDWMTRAELTAGADGTIHLCGFKGDYTVTVRSGEKTDYRTFQLASEPQKIQIILK